MRWPGRAADSRHGCCGYAQLLGQADSATYGSTSLPWATSGSLLAMSASQPPDLESMPIIPCRIIWTMTSASNPGLARLSAQASGPTLASHCCDTTVQPFPPPPLQLFVAGLQPT